MKPHKILFFLLLALALTACAQPTAAPTPTAAPPSHTPIPPTVTFSPPPPTATITPSPVPSHTPTATPTATATPTDNPYLSIRCLQVFAGLPPVASLEGVLAFQSTSDLDAPAFLLDLGSGERTVLETAANERRSRYSVSTGGHWLSFVRTLFDDQGAFRERSLVVLDARGQEQASFPLSEHQSTIYPRGGTWLDDQRILIWPGYNPSVDYSPHGDEAPDYYQMQVVNPFAYQSTTLDMRGAWGFDIFAPDEAPWEVPVVPDPTLRWVAYPGYITTTTGAEIGYDIALLLWDRQSDNRVGIPLEVYQERLNSRHGYPQEGPKWSPDGTRLVFISWNSGGEELVIVDREGQVLQKTRLGDVYEQITIADYVWSPDGSQIAFWMSYPHKPSSGTYQSWRGYEEMLALLDVASGQVTNLCIPMDSGLVLLNPVWSPDWKIPGCIQL